MTVANPLGLLGIELGYAEITANVNNITALQDIAGLAITVAVTSRPFVVEAGGPFLQNNTAADGSLAQIVRVDTAAVVAFTEPGFGAASEAYGWYCRKRLSLPAGSYTFKVQAQVIIGGATLMRADPTAPAWIQAVQV